MGLKRLVFSSFIGAVAIISAGCEASDSGASSSGVGLSGEISLEAEAGAGLTSTELDTVSMTATHKVDVDVVDQCLSGLQITLGRTFEGELRCQLTLTATEPDPTNPNHILVQGRFEADSFCPNFSDSDEGLYDTTNSCDAIGYAIIDANFNSSGSTLDVNTTVTLHLDGTLYGPGGKPLTIAADGLQIAGAISSTGTTDNTCLVDQWCSGGNGISIPDPPDTGATPDDYDPGQPDAVAPPPDDYDAGASERFYDTWASEGEYDTWGWGSEYDTTDDEWGPTVDAWDSAETWGSEDGF